MVILFLSWKVIKFVIVEFIQDPKIVIFEKFYLLYESSFESSTDKKNYEDLEP